MTRRHRSTKGSADRRGFALVLVLLLGLVAGLVAVVMLEMQSASRLAVDSQVRTYERHHTSAGARELLNDWLRSAGANIAAAVNEDGKAFDLGSGSSMVSVYLFDAQGPALRDAAARGTTRGSIVQDVSRMLSAMPEPREGETPILRNVGPVTVSAHTAPVEVLAAIAAAAGNPGAAPTFASAVISARASKTLTAGDMTEIAQQAGLTQQQIGLVSTMLTYSPELWRVEVRQSRGNGFGSEYRQGGLIALPQTNSSGISGVSVLTWEDLPPLR